MKTINQSNINFITAKLNQWAKERGFYNQADIERAENDIADEIILDNLPTETPLPQFKDYTAKVNYIAINGFGLY